MRFWRPPLYQLELQASVPCAPKILLFLPKNDTLPALRTVFLALDLVRILLLVLACPVSRLMIASRHEGNDLLHRDKTFSFVLKKPRQRHGFQ